MHTLLLQLRGLSSLLGTNRAKPKTATPGVCLNSNPDPPSIWAQSVLGFKPQNVQAEVLDFEGPRLILCCPRQWGKSTVIALKALHYAIHHPGHEILVVSDSEDHAGIIVQKLIANASMLGIHGRRAHGKQYSIELPNGAKVFAVAHNLSAPVGYTAHIVIVDEAAMVDDTVFAYVSRTLARTDGAMWLLSTPRGQTGLFYNIWHDKDTRYHKVKATLEDASYLSPAFVQEQKRLFPATYKQDFLCEFQQAPGRLLSRERIAKNVDPALNSRIIPHTDDYGEDLE